MAIFPCDISVERLQQSVPGQLHVSKLFKKLKLSCCHLLYLWHHVWIVHLHCKWCNFEYYWSSFFTRRFNLHQLNYSVMKKDIALILAIFWGLCWLWCLHRPWSFNFFLRSLPCLSCSLMQCFFSFYNHILSIFASLKAQIMWSLMPCEIPCSWDSSLPWPPGLLSLSSAVLKSWFPL